MIEQRKWLAALGCLIWITAANCLAQSNQKPAPVKRLKVADIQAKLFYETNGNFSSDVFSGKVNLWNTVIEGASREGASESMLVVVEVKAEGGDWHPAGRKVQLIARYRIADASDRGKPAFFSKTMKISLGSTDNFFAGFWLYETGCHPVHLSARIVGQPGWLRKTVNLGCGE